VAAVCRSSDLLGCCGVDVDLEAKFLYVSDDTKTSSNCIRAARFDFIRVVLLTSTGVRGSVVG
jgi:hypothetical protein